MNADTTSPQPIAGPPPLPRTALVMGLGVHGGGLGVARWLLRQGVQVTVTDREDAERLAPTLHALAETERETGNPVRYVLGEHHEADFTSHDMLVANPAVRPDSPWLEVARQAGVPIETAMTLFFRHCPGPIIGITGTKGKTTTTLLTGAMLRQQYADTVVAGNLRVSALEALPHITPTTPVVLELSSFQLVGLGAARLSPPYACITNFSPDHLNYHGTMAAYAAAKQQVFLHQSTSTTSTTASGDSGDPGGLVVLPPDLLAGFYPPEIAARRPAGSLVTFRPHDSEADCTVDAAGHIRWRGETVASLDDVALPGRHNLANVLAAVALARSVGVAAPAIRAALHSFQGVEHRLERVRTLEGRQYINDTTATNPAAAVAALQSFAAPIVLLAGGADKKLEMVEFAAAIVQRARVVVLLEGSATPRLLLLLHEQMQRQSRRLPVLGPYNSLEAALHAARRQSQVGDLILLSPGCASFGMFRNEFHRGEEFRRMVCALQPGR